MHPGTDLFARLAMFLTHIRKKAFQIFTPNHLPFLFHTHLSGACLGIPSLAVMFFTEVEATFRRSVFYNGLGVQG